MGFATKVLAAGSVTAGIAIVGAFSVQLLRSDITAAAYRERLDQVASDYAQLRDRYNDAVRDSAVTELLVQDNRVSIIVRDADGVRRTIETPFASGSEIYVDFVVLDSKLWIRRVFDADTPPSGGVLVDPEIDVDWAAPTVRYGKAVYRSLDEGRWVVAVTGNGSLGLERADDSMDIELAYAPEVTDFDEASLTELELDPDLSFGGLFRHLVHIVSGR